MKKFIWLSALIFFGLMLQAQTPIPAGDVSGLWSIDGSPYLIEGEITVPLNETLVIEPGVAVNFQGYYKFNILGTLLATGNEQDSILFTTDDPETGWHSIRIIDTENNTQDTTRIRYCRIEYGKSSGTCPDNCGGGIFISHGRSCITHCTIQHNSAYIGAADWGGGGIYSEYSNPVISENLIQHNHSGHDGGGIYCSYGSPVISDNIIRNNDSDFRGGGIASFLFAAPQISNNIIENNSCNNLGGGLYLSGGDASVVHNSIINNTGNEGGGFGLYLNNSKIINNLITGNEANHGGAIYNKGSSPWIFNNTIAQNEAFIEGGGIYNTFEMIGMMTFNSNPLITNTIIHANTAPSGFSIESINESNPIISYSVVEGLNGNGVEGLFSNLEGNIDNDPLFDISGEFHFALSSSSPSIDTGKEDLSNMEIPTTDLLNHLRVWDGNGDQNAIIDMGAYEYGSSGMGMIDYIYNPGFSISPNPVKNYIEIIFNIPIPSKTITLKVFSMDGSIVKSVVKHSGNNINTTFYIEVSSLNPGAYIIRCQYDKVILGSNKFIKH